MSFEKPHRWALAGILLVALGLRVWGIGFGLPHANARPDETSVAGPAVTFLSGDFEPPHFMYPTGFMYALSGVYVAYYEVTRPWATYKTLIEFAESRRQNLGPFLLISRSISVLFGVLTVLWLYLLGARTAGRAVGLISSAFLAVSFLHVRDSHFGVTDATKTGLVVLAVYLIVRWHEAGTTTLAARAGLVGGLAMGTKYNGLGVAVPFAVAALDRIAVSWRARKPIAPVFASGAVFVAMFAAVFLAGSFYIFIQPERFVNDVTLQGRTLEAGHGVWEPRGWFYHAVTTLPAAVGWPMYIAGVAGIVWFLAKDFRRAIVIFAFPIAYYVIAGSGRTVFARYMLPDLPFLCLGAGYICVRFVEMYTGEGAAWRTTAAAISLAMLLGLPTAVKSIQVDRLLNTTDNRVVVADALETTLPPEATFYQSGSDFGKIQPPVSLKLRVVTFNPDAAQFDGPPPDWILIQKSPLPQYSEVPAPVTNLLAGQYTLSRTFDVGDDRPRTYDPQDAFFLPLVGLEGIERPGPAFKLYRKKE